jgi:hypothetical protein
VKGKDKPPHYDLKAATKEEWLAINPDGTLPTSHKIEG